MFEKGVDKQMFVCYSTYKQMFENSRKDVKFMKQLLTRRFSPLQKWLAGFVTVVALCTMFCVLYSSQVSANNGDYNRIKGYEQVLVRPGDTLTSLARDYSTRYYHGSVSEYREQIVRLNNLSSEYIRSGTYLMMPKVN